MAAILGVGGGFLYVPTLMLIFSLQPNEAVGTSLAVVIFTSLSASTRYAKQKRIFYKSGIIVMIPAMIFSAIGAYLTDYIPSNLLALIFAAALFLISLKMIFPRIPLVFSLKFGPYFLEKRTDAFEKEVELKAYYIHLITWGSLAGLVAGLLGVGGGIINVPSLTLLGLPIHYAVATSSFIIFLTAVSGSLIHSKLGQVNINYVIPYAIGAVIGAQIGAKLAPKIESEKLRKYFGIAMILVAIRIILVKVVFG